MPDVNLTSRDDSDGDGDLSPIRFNDTDGEQGRRAEVGGSERISYGEGDSPFFPNYLDMVKGLEEEGGGGSSDVSEPSPLRLLPNYPTNDLDGVKGLERGGGRGSSDVGGLSPFRLLPYYPDRIKELGDAEWEGEVGRRRVGGKGRSNSGSSKDNPPSPPPTSPFTGDPERRGDQGTSDSIRGSPQYTKSLQYSEGTLNDKKEILYYRPIRKENRRKAWRYGDDFDFRPYNQQINRPKYIKSLRHSHRQKPQRKRFISEDRQKASPLLSKL